MGGDPRQRAWDVLHGKRPVPAMKPQRIELARELPILAEDLLCSGDEAALDALSLGVQRLWRELGEDDLAEFAWGTPQLAWACKEAASLLGLELDPDSDDLLRPNAQQRASPDRPRVYAPLVGDEPAQVFQSSQPADTPSDDPSIRATQELVRRMLGTPPPRWGLGRHAPGRSKMAALFLRAVLERWPEKLEVLSQWNTEQATIGVTGELDEQGIALPIDGLEDKIQRFFRRHGRGRLFVPASQWGEACRILGSMDPEPAPWPEDFMQELSRWRIQPFRSALDLLLRLGITSEACPETQLFEKLRRSYERVTLWNNDRVELLKTVSPHYIQPPRQGSREPRTLDEAAVLNEVHENFLAGRARPLFIVGGPGSGKSIALQRLAARWHQESGLFGPAIRVNAGDLDRLNLDLGRALMKATRPALTQEECRQFVTLARSKALAGGVWLLVDGLDQVSASARGSIRKLIDNWPAPTIIGARPLPAEASDHPSLRISPLDAHQQKKLLERLGKKGHWEALTGDKTVGIQADRRKLMVTDLCSTPLGVSLLSEFSETELGPTLNVQKILRGGIIRLLERAEQAGRISEDVRLRVSRSGLPVLGIAAWSMICRGEATLLPEDLERMGHSSLADDVHKVIDKSDLVQRVGPMDYEFSHKSMAELCAALHLCTQDEAESALLARMGDPGVEAVAFHFGALVPRERLGPFLRALARNPRRPMSSLAVATRLLGATGPERTNVTTALEVLLRRVRLASGFGLGAYNLPGGVGELDELWRALERWSEALRPHAQQLIAACSPVAQQFLSGQLPPLVNVNPERPIEDPYSACEFAERLALTLGLEKTLPLRAVARFKQGRELLEQRPSGQWVVEELESLFDMPDDDSRASPSAAAATVWALRASPERKLQRLDVLSRFDPEVLRPVIETVAERGTPEQRREALLRAALAGLEHAGKDEALQDAGLQRRRHYAQLPREKLLRRWELLWNRGLVGRQSRPASHVLEPLYATFLDDGFGPARWRALVAQGDHAVTLTSLRDDFSAVRVETLRKILFLRLGHGVEPQVEIPKESFHAELDDERWMAFAARGWDPKLPLEELLRVLMRRTTPPHKQADPLYRSLGPIPSSPPWLQHMRMHGENARHTLLDASAVYVQDEHQHLLFFSLLETELGSVAEELGNMLPAGKVPLDMLAHGRPRQRRVAAQAFVKHPEVLAPYVNDPDPEIAKLARRVTSGHRRQQEQADRARGNREAMRQQPAPKRKPFLEPYQIERFTSLEEIWKVLPDFTVGLPMNAYAEAQQRLREKALQEEDSLLPAEPSRSVSQIALHEAHWLTRRLSMLYEPRHASLLIQALENKDLDSFAACVLHEHLPIPELLPLVLSDGMLGSWAVAILQGTAQGREAAALMRSELLAGRLDARLSNSSRKGDLRQDEQGKVLWSPGERLHRLDGLPSLLAVLEATSQEWLRRDVLATLERVWGEMKPASLERTEVIAWARRMEHAGEAELRELAWKILARAGKREDADRWLPVLLRDDNPEPLLIAAIRIVSRFPQGAALERLRALIRHSPIIGAEAVVALTQSGEPALIEELVALFESWPKGLVASALIEQADWRSAIIEMVIRLGDGAQARRIAHSMRYSGTAWRVASRHFRLPEHLLFLMAQVGFLCPGEENDNEYHDMLALTRKAIARVGEATAQRVILEAAFWSRSNFHPDSLFRDDFRTAAQELIEHVGTQDSDILLEALRRYPDDTLAIRWLGGTPQGEELLDQLWREQRVPWWAPGASQ